MDVGNAKSGQFSGSLVLRDRFLHVVLGVALENANGGQGESELKAQVLRDLHVRVGGQVDDRRTRQEGLESIGGHLGVVLVQRHPRHLDQSIPGVIVAKGSAVREIEEVAHPKADFSRDSG